MDAVLRGGVLVGMDKYSCPIAQDNQDILMATKIGTLASQWRKDFFQMKCFSSTTNCQSWMTKLRYMIVYWTKGYKNKLFIPDGPSI